MRRREFITLLGGATAAWPLAASAQQPDRMRRIGVLTPFASDDPVEQTRVLAFAQALAQSGWIEGRNVRIEIRWGASDPERVRRYAAELVALAPDVILAVSSATTEPLLQATRTVPIVFVQVAEPVGAGFVETLARPGGNVTGFMRAPPATSIASSTARNRPTFRCRHRPSISWPSTSRPPGRSAWKCRRRCSSAPTR